MSVLIFPGIFKPSSWQPTICCYCCCSCALYSYTRKTSLPTIGFNRMQNLSHRFLHFVILWFCDFVMCLLTVPLMQNDILTFCVVWGKSVRFLTLHCLMDWLVLLMITHQSFMCVWQQGHSHAPIIHLKSCLHRATVPVTVISIYVSRGHNSGILSGPGACLGHSSSRLLLTRDLCHVFKCMNMYILLMGNCDSLE